VSISQVSIVNNMMEYFTVRHALAFGSRSFHECYIIPTSVIQKFNLRKGHVHLHKRITKTVRYDADVHTTHTAHEIRNARIPDETGLFGLTGCRWGN